ncbi:MAG: DHH family phosphoesterase [Candidatus Methanomethyliaceae archaeon]|nr:DHH family phosphoesterase [Candidatus Methanomethyliaceae archaeon]
MAQEGESLLLKRAESIANDLLSIPKEEEILIVSHLDADGIAAGSIMLHALLDYGANPCLRIVKQLDMGVIEDVADSPSKFVVFVDMGSGQKPLLQKLEDKNKKLFIIDHHQPEPPEMESEINPHMFGYNGSNDISASGTAYLVAKRISSNNPYTSQLAIAGALGDIQDRGERASLVGLNKAIAVEAESKGLLKTKLGLKLYGFESRPLVQCLANTIEPYLPGLSGDEGACLKFIKSLGIDPVKADGSWRSQADLSNNELRTLLNGIIKYLISQGLSSKEAESVVGTLYIFPNEPPDSPLRDAREFASSINACGRLGKYGLGVSICMGDRGQALEELKQTLQEYRKTISRYLNWIQTNNDSIKILPYVQAINGGTVVDDRMIGTIISITYSTKPFSLEKPIVGFAVSSDCIKVSARASPNLVKKGLNLGALIKEAAEKFGGAGGGHNIAAGAQIPIGREEAFLQYLNELISKNMGVGEIHAH